MKPVDQTTFGNPGGNCFSACVASLLDLEIGDVPYFMDDDPWWLRFEAWLLDRGYWPLVVPLDGGWSPPGLHILSGVTAGKSPHSVVARGLEIVHDPHQDRPGLARRDRAIAIIPLDPRRTP